MKDTLNSKPKALFQLFEPQLVGQIITNILEACKDIARLSDEGYRWISKRNGFDANCNREDFITDYQSSLNLRNNILVYEHANIHCNQTIPEIDLPYYQQQCVIYRQILDQLKANPLEYRQKGQVEYFFIEFRWCAGNDMHQITLCSIKGTVSVNADKQFLLSLANNIHSHLQESEALINKQS